MCTGHGVVKGEKSRLIFKFATRPFVQFSRDGQTVGDKNNRKQELNSGQILRHDNVLLKVVQFASLLMNQAAAAKFASYSVLVKCVSNGP